MKKILTAIAAAALLAVGNAPAASADFPYLGPLNPQDEINTGFATDLQMVLNQTQPTPLDTTSTEDNSFKTSLDNLLKTDYQAFLQEPATLLAGWDGENETPNAPGGLLGNYCKNGCCIDADCALNAIGWGDAMRRLRQ